MKQQSGDPMFEIRRRRHETDKAARMLAIVVGVCAFAIVVAWLAYHAEWPVCS